MVCGKNFSSGNALGGHRWRMGHDVEGQHKCDQCPFTFSGATYLKRHIRDSHNGRRSTRSNGSESPNQPTSSVEEARQEAEKQPIGSTETATPGKRKAEDRCDSPPRKRTKYDDEGNREAIQEMDQDNKSKAHPKSSQLNYFNPRL